MKKQPLVSVGIPTYNRPAGLQRTLECITKQTYKNLEIIVSDNCSPNLKVKEIVQNFQKKDKRIQYYRQAKNIYVNNFKFVLDKASGKYFMWAADDDSWKKEYIEKCIAEFKNNNKVVLVSSACKFIDPLNKKPDYIDYGLSTPTSKLTDNFKLFRSLINTRRYTNSIIYGIYNKKYLLKFLPFVNILASDHLLIAKVCLMGRIITLPYIGIIRRRGGASDSFKKTAVVQGIKNPLIINYPFLVREFYFQKIIWNSRKLTIKDKIDLSFFSVIKYLDKSSRSIINQNIHKIKLKLGYENIN